MKKEKGYNEYDIIEDLQTYYNAKEHIKKDIETRDKYKRYKSVKSCTFYEFISMIQKITERTIGQKQNVLFYPEEGKIPVESFSTQTSGTIITYKLITREPIKEIGYRHRESIVEYDEQGKPHRKGEVLGQKQQILVQFDFFSPTVREVEEVMNKFEENMILYKGYLMQNGVGEIIFQRQETDEKLETFRQSTSVRSLIYYVEIEKLIEKLDHDIISIDIING